MEEAECQTIYFKIFQKIRKKDALNINNAKN